MRIQVNGDDREVRGSRLTDMLQELGYDPAQRGIAVARNGEIVRRAEWPLLELSPGDRIEVVGAVQGG